MCFCACAPVGLGRGNHRQSMEKRTRVFYRPTGSGGGGGDDCIDARARQRARILTHGLLLLLILKCVENLSVESTFGTEKLYDAEQIVIIISFPRGK